MMKCKHISTHKVIHYVSANHQPGDYDLQWSYLMTIFMGLKILKS